MSASLSGKNLFDVLIGTEQCCQLSDFSDPFSDFFFLKRLATNLATFGKNLSNFPNVASTVLRAGDLELHLSLCLL